MKGRIWPPSHSLLYSLALNERCTCGFIFYNGHRGASSSSLRTEVTCCRRPSVVLGITRFDLLGDFGRYNWLGNFYIVFLYNMLFAGLTSASLIKTVTWAVQRELIRAFGQFLFFFYLTELTVYIFLRVGGWVCACMHACYGLVTPVALWSCCVIRFFFFCPLSHLRPHFPTGWSLFLR